MIGGYTDKELQHIDEEVLEAFGNLVIEMSPRAQAAISQHKERPYLFWTREAVIDGVKECCLSLDLQYSEAIENMDEQNLFIAFLRTSSYHHIGESLIPFMAIDPQAVSAVFADDISQTAKAVSALRQEHQEYQRNIAYGDIVIEEDPEYEKKRDELRSKFQDENGYPSNSVMAFMEKHPEQCTFNFNSSQLPGFENLGL